MLNDIYRNIKNNKYISKENSILNYELNKTLYTTSPINKSISHNTEKEQDIKKFTKLVLAEDINFECDDKIIESIINNPQFLNDIMI